MPNEPTDELWQIIDALLLKGARFEALIRFREQTGANIPDAQWAIAERLLALRVQFPEAFPKPKNSVADIIERFEALPQPVVAVEAVWDGDTSGWYLVLFALRENPAGHERRYQEHQLAVLQGDNGDLRLFNNQVPPWPEAQTAQQVGAEVTARFGVPFYFPSPNYPEQDCPRWRERHRGTPCAGCGIPLLQEPDHPWRGRCYQCHLAEEKRQRGKE